MRARLIAFVGVCSIACATAEDVEGTITTTGDSGLGTGGDSGSTGIGGSSAGGSGGFPSGGSGGFPSGGTAGTASGGVGGGTGGAATGGAGGSGGSGTCPSGQKKCGGICVQPNPGIGCNLTDCTACPQPPTNSTWFCNSGTCDFTCTSGYVKQGQTCISTGSGGTSSGGAPGGGGTGGGTCPAPCDAGDPASQFVCFAFCAFSGGAGLCVPGLNCCTCVS